MNMQKFDFVVLLRTGGGKTKMRRQKRVHKNTSDVISFGFFSGKQ